MATSRVKNGGKDRSVEPSSRPSARARSRRSICEYLEHTRKAHFYNLLGGLADNVLTIGSLAGSFLECTECGQTFSLKAQSWRCQRCDSCFDIKVGALIKDKKAVGVWRKTRIQNVKKSVMTPHWYYANENWTAAEFVMLITRLQVELFLPAWLVRLGVRASQKSAFDAVLAWPRLKFGRKTVQPDFVVSLGDQLVTFEFKRPEGAAIPPAEIAAQAVFAEAAAAALRRHWLVVVVPGRKSSLKQDAGAVATSVVKYLKSAEGRDSIQRKFPAETIRPLQDRKYLADHLRVFDWEMLVATAMQTARQAFPPSWSRDSVIDGLRFFHRSRAALGLLDPMEPSRRSL